MKRANTALIIAVLFTVPIFGYFFWTKNQQPPKEQLTQAENKESTQEENEEVKEEVTPNETKTEVDLSNLKLPILMYHHIRDYNFDRDQIGTNLSVSPAKFRDQLDFIQKEGYKTVTFSDLESGVLPEKPVILTFDDGYMNFYEYAYPELKKRGMSAVVYVIVNNINKSSYMTTEQIKEINKNGIEIGSHTLSHPDLTGISLEKAKSEIGESKSELEKVTEQEIISLCYPSGQFNSEIESLAKTSGYHYAVTTKAGQTTFENSFSLQRERVNSDTNITAYFK